MKNKKYSSLGIAINIKCYSYISCSIWSSHPRQSPHTRSLLWQRQKLLHVPLKLWQWWHCLQPARVKAYIRIIIIIITIIIMIIIILIIIVIIIIIITIIITIIIMIIIMLIILIIIIIIIQYYNIILLEGIHQSAWILRFYWNSPDFTSSFQVTWLAIV